MEYQHTRIRPSECLKEGWELIKPRYWLFVALTFVGLLIGSLGPLGLFIGPMICGIYACLFLQMRGEKVSFGVLFKGFEHFLESFIATLLQLVPMMAPMIPINMYFALKLSERILVWMGPPYDEIVQLLGPTVMLGIVVGVTAFIFILSVILGTFFMFSYPLIVDRRMKGVASVKLSAKASWENLRGVASLMVATTLLSLLSSALCYVGAVLVMPLTLAAWAVAYRKVFPTTDLANSTPATPV